MGKIDLRKEYQHIFQASAKKVTIVDVPSLRFLMIDGLIEPGALPGTSQAFQQAMGALFSMSYTLKFASKLRKENPVDYTVMGLEALWWVEEGVFDIRKPDNWHWTAMILQPEHITEEMFQEALQQVAKKKPNPALQLLHFEVFHEGLSMQTLHVGPYSDEPRTLEKMDLFAQENGYIFRGKHHEIYLGDPRKAAPEKLKTVLRQPIEKPRGA